MKMYRINSILLVIILLIGGCKKKENDEMPVIQEEEQGAIFITVAYYDQPVSGAVVSTDPETSVGTTSGTGSVMIKNVPAGIYQIVATKEGIGSGSGVVNHDQGALSDLVVFLEPGVFEGPMVDIVSVSTQNTIVGYNVYIEAVVTDSVDSGGEIAFEWSTDLDGVISSQGANNNGYASINHIFDSAGERTLTVTVTNSEGDTDSDQVTINVMELPDPVVLQPIEIVNNSMHLNWSQADTNDFILYRIHREDLSGTTEIEYIYDINTTSYIDHDVNMGIEYSYQIELYIGGNAEIMSNTETGLFDGDYITIGTSLNKLLHDPNYPIIYGIDTENNSLVIIDTDLEQVVNTINVGASPTDMDFSLDNQLLYIANAGSDEITVVDLTTQSVQSSLVVETGTGVWGGNPKTLAVMADGKLAFAADSYSYIKIVDITTGNNVYTTIQSVYNPSLIASSDGTQLYVGEAGSTGSELLRYMWIEDELALQENSDGDLISDGQVFIGGNDNYIFYSKRKFLASNVTSIAGTYDDDIYAINSDGSRAVSENTIYNGFNFLPVGNLPLSTKISVFGDDDSTIYLFQEETDRLYKVTIE